MALFGLFLDDCRPEAEVHDSCKISDVVRANIDLEFYSEPKEFFIHALPRMNGNIGGGKEILSISATEDGDVYIHRNRTYIR